MSKWEWKKLGEVCEIICGQDYKDVECESGAYPVYGSGGVIGYAREFRCPANCTIVGRKGSINNPMYVEEPFWNIDTAFGLSAKGCMESKYLFYFCKCFDFTTLDKSSGRPSLARKDLLEIQIPIPPLSEQKRIVKFLDEEFSKIDTLKTNAETNLKNAKELFETTLEKELNPPSRHSERSEESSAELPSGWEWKKMRDVCDVRDGTHDSPKYHKEGYPLVTSKNLKNGLIDIDNVKYISKEDYDAINKRSKVCIGDILFAMIGTIGNAVLVTEEPYYAIKNVALFKKSSLINPSFLRYILNSSFILEKMQQEAKGTTQRFVGLDYLRSFQIPLPPLSVQKEIVARLDKLSENVKHLEANYKQIIADCDELKKSILKKTFEGES
jgi:type I restriction enzyme S subunit